MGNDRLKEARDPHLPERTERARDLAIRVADGTVETQEDLEMSVRLVISRHYGLPMFDDYFEKRTYDELAFEAFLIAEFARRENERPQDAVVKNLSEAAKYASEGWEDEDPEPPTLGEAEKKAIGEFFKTNTFQGEKPK